MPGKEKTVFISYRRVDTSGYAGRLYDRLSEHFGEDNIFMDVEQLDPGVNFVDAIQDAVRSCGVLVALIGPRWLTVQDRGGGRRLDNPEDFVRLEIATALEDDVYVIPILVGNAEMPVLDQFPDGLQELAYLNALEIRHERFNADAYRLVRCIKKLFQAKNRQQIHEERVEKAVESNPETIPPQAEPNQADPPVREQIKKNVQETFDPNGIPQLETKLIPQPNPADADTEVTWTLEIHNKGNVPIKNLTVVHERMILEDVNAIVGGKTHELTFTTSYSTVGDHTEIVRLFGAKVHRKVSGTVEVQKPPHLSLELATVSETVEMRKQIPWSLTIVNDGGVDLNHVMLRRGRTLLDDPFDLTIGEERQFSFKKSYHDLGEYTEKVTATAMAESGGRLRWMTEAQVKVGFAEVILTTPVEMALIHIPAGEFLMGSDKDVDKDAQSNELPQHRLHLHEYYIGKTPVTNAQYRVFVQNTGHEAPSHWKHGSIPSGKENHPVVNVSWHDSIAFCNWLSKQTGKLFRLPSEAEWEKAARGTEGLIYPWGNQWDRSRCNSEESGIGDTTAVRKYSPQGDSPYGCVDIAGNVWEWTRSLKKAYPYDPENGRENLDTGDRRVLRGGSWLASHRSARVSARYISPPDNLWRSFGFRLCVHPR